MFRFQLLWVLFLATVMGLIIQFLAARLGMLPFPTPFRAELALGLVTGKHLSQVRPRMPFVVGCFDLGGVTFFLL